mgnify:CR=1 FL=1
MEALVTPQTSGIFLLQEGKVWVLAATSYGLAGAESTTRGLFGGGEDAGSAYNIIQYITIGSTGNTTDFGDLSVGRHELGGCSSATASGAG